MAYELRRNGRRYYYRARRVGQRVIKEYVGGGKAGREAAEQDAAAGAERKQAVQRQLEQRRVLEDLAGRIDALGARVELLLACERLCAGWKPHKRQWRYARDG